MGANHPILEDISTNKGRRILKHGVTHEITVLHETITQQMGKFDFSGETIKRIYVDGLDLGIWAGYPANYCYLESFSGCCVEFTNGDFLYIQGFDGGGYDEVFFVSVEDHADEKYLDKYRLKAVDTVFGPFCYGKKIKGFKFKSEEQNKNICCSHCIGLELEDGNVLWFEQEFDNTNIFINDADDECVCGDFNRWNLISTGENNV